MNTIKIKGELDEHKIPHVYLNVINPETNMTAVIFAIIDTGAAFSALKQSVIDLLNLNKIKEQTTEYLMAGKIEVGVYEASLAISDKCILEQIEFKTIKPDDSYFEAVIGMDLIKYCDFKLNHQSKLFELEFYLDEFLISKDQ